MAHDDRERASPDWPADLKELLKRLAAHPLQSVQRVGFCLLAYTVAVEREWALLSMQQIQDDTGISRRGAQEAARILEAEHIYRRARRGGRPNGPEGRGDYYAPGYVRSEAPGRSMETADEEASEQPPVRAGPAKGTEKGPDPEDPTDPGETFAPVRVKIPSADKHEDVSSTTALVLEAA